MQLARHKTPNFTDYVYTDATQLPSKEKLEMLANVCTPLPINSQFLSPRGAPLNSGQTGFEVGKLGPSQKLPEAVEVLQAVESKATCIVSANPVPNWQKFKMVGETRTLGQNCGSGFSKES